jgi:NAD(P)-dependent dehydrogenase (short-subunit alcohol dehydrogenase family)
MDRIEAANPKIITEMIEHSALRRFTMPDDVASAVLFLSSALANNITGQSINVCGGRSGTRGAATDTGSKA